MCVLRINQQQQHHSHHNPHHHHQQQQNPGGDQQQQIRISHQMYPNQSSAGSKGMMAGKGMMPNGVVIKTNDQSQPPATGMYPQKVSSQFRKYNGPPSTTTTNATTRVDSSKPKVVSTMDTSHIPTVSANGIPGAAETTVSNLRTASVPNGTILSSEEKCGGLDGMLGKEKTAMCLVNELSRYNKVSQHETDSNEK